MLRYRELHLEDIPKLLPMYIRAFNGEPWRDHWTKETAGKRLRQMLQHENVYGLMAYSEMQIEGFLLGEEEQYYDGLQFQIREFCVKQQGRGVGTQLYKEAEHRLQMRGMTEIILYTLHHPATEAFYQKQGFLLDTTIVSMKKRKQ